MSQTFCQILSITTFFNPKRTNMYAVAHWSRVLVNFVSLILFVRLNSPNLHVSSVSLTFHCIPPNFLANNSAISSNKRRGVGFPYQSQRFSYPFFHPSQFAWRFSCTAYILLWWWCHCTDDGAIALMMMPLHWWWCQCNDDGVNAMMMMPLQWLSLIHIWRCRRRG